MAASRARRRVARPRAQRMSAAVRREQILDAALASFARFGFWETSTASIAARLGVAEPTIFRLFPTKRSLYLASLDRSSEIVLARWRALAAAAASPMAALLAIGQWHLDALGRDPDPLVLRFRSYADSTDPEVAAHVRTHFEATVAFVRRLYEQAHAAGELPPSADPGALAWLFMSVGALLDVTQVLELRQAFDLDALASVMRMAGLFPAAARPSRRTPAPRLTARRAQR